MYSVKNKIELFNKMVYKKNKDEKEKEIKALKENYEEKLENLKEEQSERKKEEINKTKKEAEKEKKLIISKAKIKVQKTLLENQGEIYKKFNKYLHENITKFLDSEDYENYLKREIDEIKKDLDKSDEVKLYIREKDENIINTSDLETVFSDDILGGFYIIKNKNIKYDCTLKAKIEENSNYIGYLLKETLNSKEGVNIES
ncbi:MAG: V-type ATP synthase subunit E family protein [bacterium]